MDAHEALFSQLETKFTADSGAGGLANSSSAGYVRHFVRMGDPSIGEDRTGNWPKIVVEIIDNDISTFGHENYDGLVRLHVYTVRDAGFTTLNAVNERLRTVYKNASLGATTTGWTFSIFTRLRSFAAPATTDTMHTVHEYSVIGCGA